MDTLGCMHACVYVRQDVTMCDVRCARVRTCTRPHAYEAVCRQDMAGVTCRLQLHRHCHSTWGSMQALGVAPPVCLVAALRPMQAA